MFTTIVGDLWVDRWAFPGGLATNRNILFGDIQLSLTRWPTRATSGFFLTSCSLAALLSVHSKKLTIARSLPTYLFVGDLLPLEKFIDLKVLTTSPRL
jgi:hypothetical protein